MVFGFRILITLLIFYAILHKNLRKRRIYPINKRSSKKRIMDMNIYFEYMKVTNGIRQKIKIFHLSA